MTVPVLELAGLALRYPGASADTLAGVDLSVQAGEMLGLLGPSGCGKSTMLRVIAGLLAPTGGEVRLNGAASLHLPPEARGCVLNFQTPHLFPHMTVAQNVGFGLRMRGMAKTETDARVSDMLARVQLPGFGARRPADLSGGQQARVALARALVAAPRLLLLDEPLASLDADLRSDLRDLIRGLHDGLGLTTILVTHDQEEAVALCDRIALMLDGRIAQCAPPPAFYNRPASRAVARFFGGRFFLPGRAEGGVFHAGARRFALPADAPQGPGHLTIRPEAVRLGEGVENIVTGVVAARRFLGIRTMLTVDLGDAVLEVAADPASAAGRAVGSPLTLSLPREALWIVD